jgi:DNA-binding Lrp family transcriptional regulator
MAMLKGQDIAILLKLAAEGGKRQSYAHIAADLGMSPSEAHAGVLRLARAGLVDGESKRVLTAGAVEFLRHGLRYVFPLERKGGLCRGVPTAHAAPCTAGVFTEDGEPPPVWPDAAGSVRGLGVIPLYRAAPQAALKDKRLYELMAVVDLLRGGRARERAWAEAQIEKILIAAENAHDRVGHGAPRPT